MEPKECYERYAPGLYRFALSILKHPSPAEDALQECFLRMLSGKRPAPGKEQAWLYRVIRNICYDMLRRKTRDAAETDQTASDDYAYLELIAPLSTMEQEIVSLRIIGNLTHREVAQVLRINPHTAQKRYERAIGKLRKIEEGII